MGGCKMESRVVEFRMVDSCCLHQCTLWDCSAFLAQQDRLVSCIHSSVFFLNYILLQRASQIPTAAL